MSGIADAACPVHKSMFDNVVSSRQTRHTESEASARLERASHGSKYSEKAQSVICRFHVTDTKLDL